MRWILCLCVVSSMLYGFAPVAQEPMDNPFDRRFALPTGQEATVEGKSMQCFSAPEYQTLIRMDTAYGHLYDWRLGAMGQIKAFELTLRSRDATILGQKDIIKTLKSDRVWLTLRQKQSQETLTNQAAGFQYEKWAMWAVIVLETGLLVYQGVAN